MSHAAQPESRTNLMRGAPTGRLARMVLVGGVATALYAGLAWVASAVLPLALASPLAYGLASLWSYAGHRRLTFADRRTRDGAVLRFSALTLAGYATATAIPALAGRLGAPPPAAILVTCLAIPAVTCVVLSRHVFPGSPVPSVPALRDAGPSAG